MGRRRLGRRAFVGRQARASLPVEGRMVVQMRLTASRNWWTRMAGEGGVQGWRRQGRDFLPNGFGRAMRASSALLSLDTAN